ncbi:general transcription factor IIH subunit 3 [Cimex lectularius]|uniref:General transcription factor IIH subunit 3 n=1 Tax=Cimex lectularius TaxID=79782 RepID=A0A8I6RXN7_CIMLE|nr:general transcription factor IIH subunit 3 [Cimex lectularius]
MERLKEEKSLLIMILDFNPVQRVISATPRGFHQLLEAIVAFANCHLMFRQSNQLAIIACHAQMSEYIYSDKDSKVEPTGQNDGQYEMFAHVERRIRLKVKEIIARLEPSLGDSLLAGACSMALCYAQRKVRELPIGDKLNSRILVITGSGESTSQYMNYMNVFFTAQKENVILDVLSIEHDLAILQQGCDITGGIYLKIPQPQGLLQYLLWVFLPEPPIRKKLVLPPPVHVDYRAACFCHRMLVDVGFVCSVCLSVFCKFSPICLMCHTLFKNPTHLPTKQKKKKKTM